MMIMISLTRSSSHGRVRVTVSELFIASNTTYSHGDSPITSVANAATMTIMALHTSQPHIFYNTEI